MKPREINPECIDDDAWWDIEALKLAVVRPHIFNAYAHDWRDWGSGSAGLAALGLFDIEHGELAENVEFRSFNQTRITTFGHRLIAACKRVAK